jgi:hypothetical protein
VVGPEGLCAVGSFDGVSEGVLAGVRAGEGDVIAGMPVLGKDDVVELRGESVDAGENGVAVGNGERAAGEEVELHIDDEEGVGGKEVHRHGSFHGKCIYRCKAWK